MRMKFMKIKKAKEELKLEHQELKRIRKELRTLIENQKVEKEVSEKVRSNVPFIDFLLIGRNYSAWYFLMWIIHKVVQNRNQVCHPPVHLPI